MQIQWTNISFREEQQTSWWPDATETGMRSGGAGYWFYGRLLGLMQDAIIYCLICLTVGHRRRKAG